MLKRRACRWLSSSYIDIYTCVCGVCKGKHTRQSKCRPDTNKSSGETLCASACGRYIASLSVSLFRLLSKCQGPWHWNGAACFRRLSARRERRTRRLRGEKTGERMTPIKEVGRLEGGSRHWANFITVRDFRRFAYAGPVRRLSLSRPAVITTHVSRRHATEALAGSRAGLLSLGGNE